MNSREAYEQALGRILERLDAGTCPWAKPWSAPDQMPRNITTGKPYRGGNVLLLAMMGGSPGWLTFRQAQLIGAQVRKGAKGVPIVYYDQGTETDKTTGEERKWSMAKVYHVFNVNDVDNIPEKLLPVSPVLTPAFTPILECEKLRASIDPTPSVVHGNAAAFFRPSTDEVHMPEPGTFRTREDYYATLFHELTHWSGGASRLARPTITDAGRFGSYKYCREELVAEIGAGFLCSMTGIENHVLDNSAAYLRNWMSHLKDDRASFFWAAGQAQKASDFLTQNWLNPATASPPSIPSPPSSSEAVEVDA